MALVRRSVHYTVWIAGFLVSMVFSWFGWSVPPFAEAARIKAPRVFTSDQALQQSIPFTKQLNEETSRRLLADAATAPKPDTYQGQVPVSQPRQAFKLEDKKELKPSRLPDKETSQPKQALKLESVAPSSMPSKKAPQTTQPLQTMTKTD